MKFHPFFKYVNFLLLGIVGLVLLGISTSSSGQSSLPPLPRPETIREEGYREASVWFGDGHGEEANECILIFTGSGWGSLPEAGQEEFYRESAEEIEEPNLVNKELKKEGRIRYMGETWP